MDTKTKMRKREGNKIIQRHLDPLKKSLQNCKISAVVLDMDGLMIDSEPLYKRSMQAAARDLGYDLTDKFMMSLVGRPDTDCRKLIMKEFGNGFPLDTFWEQWPLIWREIASSEGIATKPGLQELLTYISDAGLPSAIATSTYREQAEFSLQAAGVTYTFAHIVTGDQVDRGKPAPDIFLEAARRLDVDPQHCVALEDSENGIRSASAANMIAIMVPDLIPPSDEMHNAASFVMDSLHDVRELISGWQNRL